MDPTRGLAVAIANSGGTTDRIGTPGALRVWLDEHVSDAGSRSDGVLLRLGDFRTLRAAVLVAFRRVTEGQPAPDDVIDALNAASAMAPMWPVLRVDGSAQRFEMETSDASETTQILASIARSAIELLGGPEAARLRECPACGRFFLASRPRQVWCSSGCGNRTRVARHRSRRAAANATR